MADSFSTRINKVIQSAGAVAEDVAVCSSWILVAEWVGADGSVWLEEHRTSDLPAWRRQGMLNYVLTENPEDQEGND